MIFVKDFSYCGLRKKINNRKWAIYLTFTDGNTLLKKKKTKKIGKIKALKYAELWNISDLNIIRKLQIDKNVENKRQNN